MKGDGNCFYRAFGFAYVKSLTSGDQASRFNIMQQFESTFSLLVNHDMDKDIIQDFFEPFQNLVRRAIGYGETTSTLSLHDLMESFNDPETSNSIVMYLRLLTSTFLKVSIETS